MTRATRALLTAGSAVAAVLLLAAGSAALALASAGVFQTSGGAWTTSLAGAGLRLRLNVPGLVRAATLPGVTHLLDGRAVATRAGALHFSRDGRTLRVTCAPCRIEHPDLAAASVSVDLVLGIAREDDRLTGWLDIGDVHAPFTGRLDAASIELAWELPPTEVATLYRALGDAVPETAFARIDGRLSAHGALSLPSGRSRLQWRAEGLDVGGLGTEPMQYGPFRFACGEPDGSARLRITGDGERTWTAADAMGPYLAAAALAAEDQRFHQHDGIDTHALDAVLAELEAGRPGRGASTITQQLARTLFTGGQRTAVRKLREALYAIEMERTLGKARILELYLNTVDWGPGVCGAKAAARAYFNKPPSRLTPIEAAWLAGVLRNPHAAWERQFATREPDRERAVQVLMQMRDWPKGQRRRFAEQPLAFARPKAKAEFVRASSDDPWKGGDAAAMSSRALRRSSR